MNRSIATVGVVALVVIALPGVAGAHAAYKDSSPANRSTVAAPPDEVWAEFTEPVTDDARLDVIDPCGARVDRGDVRVSGYTVTVSMSADSAGTYRVAFRVVSALDGHPTSGQFTFTSSGGVRCGDDEGNGAPSSARRSGGSGSAPSTRGAGSDDGDPAGAGEASDPDPRSASGDDRADRAKSGNGGNRPGRRAARGRGDARPAGAVLAQEAPAQGADIPADWLLIGFGISALIGAIAGQIYASIVGPGKRAGRRKR